MCDNKIIRYNVNIFQNIMQGEEPYAFYSCPLSADGGARLTSLAWNPCDPSCLALTASTGTLSLVNIKEKSFNFSEKQQIGAK